MIQSRIESLINFIKDYVTYHGRLVLGTTVLLCLVTYLGWTHSVWDEVETLESPVAVAKEEYKNQARPNVKSNRKKEYHRNDKNTNQVEEKGKLVLGVRQVQRPYPLQDMFQYDAGGTVMPHDTSKKETMEEGNRESPRKEQPQRRRHTIHEVPPSLSPSLPQIQSHQVVRLGLIRGERTYVMLSIDGMTYTVGLGESIDGVRVIAVDGDRICIEERGERRWIG